MGVDRPGVEPGSSRVRSGCDATTPTAPELRRPSVLNDLLGTAFRAEDPPVRPFFFLSAAGALLWLALAVGKRVRPGKALQHLQGTVFRAEALSRPARALLWLALAVDKRVRPGKAREAMLFWLAAPSGPIALLHIGLSRDEAPGRGGAGCRRTPLVRARCGEASAASKRAGREAVLAACALGTDSFLPSV